MTDLQQPTRDWATDFDHTRRLRAGGPGDLGRPARPVPRRPHRRPRRRVDAHPPRGRVRHRPRHRALQLRGRDRERLQARRPGARWASPRPSRRTRRSTHDARRLLLPAFAPQGHRPASRSRHPRSVPRPARRAPRRRRRRGRRRRAATRSTSRSGSSPTCSACPRRTATSSACSSTGSSRSRATYTGTVEPEDTLDFYLAEHRSSAGPTSPRDDLIGFLHRRRDRRRAAARRAHRRHHRPAAHRRHRHHVVGHRRQPLAPGPAPRRPPAPASTTPSVLPFAVEEFLRFYAPVDHGPHRRRGRRDRRLPGARARLGAAPLPRRQPRPRGVRARRRVRHRPPAQPPRRLRPRHPPLPRLEPGPHGAHGRRRGVDEAHPRLRAGRPRPPCAGRPARSAGPASSRCASCVPVER